MKNIVRRRRFLEKLGAAAILSALGSSRTALAQRDAAADYPAKPIRLFCPFAAGGGVDITARAIAQKLTEGWGQPVVVENRPGANGTIAVALAAKAPPDGYTLTMITSSHTGTVTQQRDQLYELMHRLVPITRAARHSTA